MAETATISDLNRRDMFAQVKQLCEPDNSTNWWVLVHEYAVLAIVIAGCLMCYRVIVENGYSLWWMAPIYVAAVLIIGIWVQNRLACLVHESSHYSLFKNRVMNDVVANLLVAFPFFGLISSYRVGHWGHHRHVNDPEKDPDLLRLMAHHPRQFPISKWRFLFEYVLLQALPHKALSYLKGRALYVAKPLARTPDRNQDVLGRPLTPVLRISYYVVLFSTLSYFGWWPHYFLLWIVPMVTVYPATLFLREIAHHGNYPDNGDYTNSRVYEGYWLEREIFFPFSERNHVLHHMFPTVPWHKMMQAHHVMMRYPPYRENVVICDGFFFKRDAASDWPSVLDLLATPSREYLTKSVGSRLPGEIRQANANEVGAVGISAEVHLQGES